MKTSTIDHNLKNEDLNPTSSIANMLTSYMGSNFKAKLAEFGHESGQETSSILAHQGVKRFLAPLTGLGAPILPGQVSHVSTIRSKMSMVDFLNELKMSTPASITTAAPDKALLASKGGAKIDSKPATGLPYQELVAEASQTYGVPVPLINAIIKQESAFNPDAKSHCGAMGLMQLMPATAKDLGCKDAFDPRENIMAGTKYIGQMLKRFDGDVSLATAAYNAGPGNVRKYGNQVPPFKETQNYVAKVGKYYKENVALAEAQHESEKAV